MQKQRKSYSGLEKSKIALEAIKGEMTLSQIASKYGVHSTQITNWKKLALTYLSEAFTQKQQQQTANYESELAGLYEQIGRLKVENEFLKKKFSLFT